MLDRALKIISSLKLTIVLLAFGIALVFFGTLAQVDEGLYAAQNRWFRSLFVVNAHLGKLYIPIFPGGYLIGTTLLVNLIAAHAVRFKFVWRKSGILLVHFGVILLLLGQLLTDMLSTESAMRLEVGQTANYSEDFHANEVIVVNTSDPAADEVVAIPDRLVAKRREITHPSLPVKLLVKNYWPNCEVTARPPAAAQSSGAMHGSLTNHLVLPLEEKSQDSRSATLIEIIGDNGSLGSWLVASRTQEPEQFRYGNRRWTLSLVFAPAMGGNFLLFSDASRSRDEQPDPIPESELQAGKEISPSNAPFKVRIRQFWPRCRLYRQPSALAVVPEINRGPFQGMMVEPAAPAKTMDARNLPAAVVEAIGPSGSLGTWLLPAGYSTTQEFEVGGKTYQFAMRFARHYKPFSVTLLKATHEKYPGTEKPKDFRSRVRVQRADTSEVRETEIYMNAPLRFAGYTFFQYQMSADELALRAGQKPSSTFQVVKNPSWLAPYISCILVGIGLCVQFMIHLVGFVTKRRPVRATEASAARPPESAIRSKPAKNIPAAAGRRSA
jgi:hypothetical protein